MYDIHDSISRKRKPKCSSAPTMSLAGAGTEASKRYQSDVAHRSTCFTEAEGHVAKKDGKE